MRRIIHFFWVLLICSCTTDEQNDVKPSNLASAIEGREIAISSVIACAGNSEDGELVNVYFYPRPGVTNIRYFETETVNEDPNTYGNYTEQQPPLRGIFNDYLQFFEVGPGREKWVIITFEENGVVHISNPIRLRHLTQMTEFLPENVSVDTGKQPTMPKFTWVDGNFGDSIIYFHVVSTQDDDLLSGTYTLEKNFQYYKLDNVVLNITREIPPELELDVRYNFSLLAVTEDNWVNLFSEITFSLQ